MFKLSTEDLKIYILERVSRLGNINIKEYNFLENKHGSEDGFYIWQIARNNLNEFNDVN
ncbi:hypothetical protein [Lactiplantibacillus plantarum]|uniref:hypothetical protein n=1 Tax=Lactiplantibacillus plantarum TaxID=1590 RepID=UPI0015A210CF|nr:hypothetical protein [Lactiplantibacillus plantarum]MBX4154068.1 hypothetical protein [Lactiplantibacillus plantarum]NVO64874.1 hypothetical protein [Lactiplantibacillus plantarum]QOF03355.1 hypothetical protein IGB08_06055 [Lactiplantibacillus plantarum]UVO57706.1 hypothetical protein M3M90_01595 [Lactiplantibacillus plantarum]WBF40502.1 hypothetical protein MUB33_01595 [Lactiplantibacillus plantarum]